MYCSLAENEQVLYKNRDVFVNNKCWNLSIKQLFIVKLYIYIILVVVVLTLLFFLMTDVGRYKKTMLLKA